MAIDSVPYANATSFGAFDDWISQLASASAAVHARGGKRPSSTPHDVAPRGNAPLDDHALAVSHEALQRVLGC
jgi:hypothetical protein